MSKASETYERVAAELLERFNHEFGLSSVEGKQRLHGERSGTNWEIDAKGVLRDGSGFVVIECRRYPRKKLDQESIAAVAYRIDDLGASGGIVVSPLQLQRGAGLVANASDVVHVQLDQDCTTTDYVLKFLGRVFVGASITEGAKAGADFSATVSRACKRCGTRFEPIGIERVCASCAGEPAAASPKSDVRKTTCCSQLALRSLSSESSFLV